MRRAGPELTFLEPRRQDAAAGPSIPWLIYNADVRSRCRSGEVARRQGRALISSSSLWDGGSLRCASCACGPLQGRRCPLATVAARVQLLGCRHFTFI